MDNNVRENKSIKTPHSTETKYLLGQISGKIKTEAIVLFFIIWDGTLCRVIQYVELFILKC